MCLIKQCLKKHTSLYRPINFNQTTETYLSFYQSCQTFIELFPSFVFLCNYVFVYCFLIFISCCILHHWIPATCLYSVQPRVGSFFIVGLNHYVFIGLKIMYLFNSCFDYSSRFVVMFLSNFGYFN